MSNEGLPLAMYYSDFVDVRSKKIKINEKSLIIEKNFNGIHEKNFCFLDMLALEFHCELNVVKNS